MIAENEEVKISDNEFVKKEVVRAKDTLGFFKTATAVPTYIPKNFLEQVVIYKNGSDYSIYAYDFSTATWQEMTKTITIINNP